MSNRKTSPPRKGAYWPIHTINLQYVVMVNDSQIVGCTPVEVIFEDHMVLYYTKGSVVRCQASVILLGEGGKEKAQ